MACAARLQHVSILPKLLSGRPKRHTEDLPATSKSNRTLYIHTLMCRPNCLRQLPVKGRRPGSCMRPKKPLMVSEPTWSSKYAGARRKAQCAFTLLRTPSESWATAATCIRYDCIAARPHQAHILYQLRNSHAVSRDY